jgi:SAM-dependent methyltransferase
MSARLQQTRKQLERHHRHGEDFARLMTDSFEERFNADFWTAWDTFIDETLPSEATIIDLGSATGQFLRAVCERHPGARAIGVECAPYMLDAMVELPESAEVVCADLHDPHLPLADGEADAALASVVIHEMVQPVRALREIHRVLGPGGRIFIHDWVRAPLADYVASQSDEATVFGTETPVETLEDLFEHFLEHNRFSREDLAWLLNRTGFDVIDSQPLRGGRFARIIAEKRGTG